MPLFSWVPIFVDLTKITHSSGSEFVAIVFSFIIHTENRYFVGTRIRGSDPPQIPRKLVPHKNSAIVTINLYTFTTENRTPTNFLPLSHLIVLTDSQTYKAVQYTHFIAPHFHEREET